MPNVHQVHNVVLTIEMSINMQNNEQTEYKTVRGLTRGLMLLNMLNKLDGGASVGLLAELSGLHRTTVRRLLETLQEAHARCSPSDDSFRLTIKVRQLSGYGDEQWISALAAPLLGDLLREVVWPADVLTLMLMNGGTRNHPPFQPLILSPGNGRATFTAPENRLGPDLAGLLPWNKNARN